MKVVAPGSDVDVADLLPASGRTTPRGATSSIASSRPRPRMCPSRRRNRCVSTTWTRSSRSRHSPWQARAVTDVAGDRPGATEAACGQVAMRYRRAAPAVVRAWRRSGPAVARAWQRSMCVGDGAEAIGAGAGGAPDRRAQPPADRGRRGGAGRGDGHLRGRRRVSGRRPERRIAGAPPACRRRVRDGRGYPARQVARDDARPRSDPDVRRRTGGGRAVGCDRARCGAAPVRPKRKHAKHPARHAPWRGREAGQAGGAALKAAEPASAAG